MFLIVSWKKLQGSYSHKEKKGARKRHKADARMCVNKTAVIYYYSVHSLQICQQHLCMSGDIMIAFKCLMLHMDFFSYTAPLSFSGYLL